MAKKKIDLDNPKFLPACLLFPKFTEEELQNLAEDILQNGLQEAIVTLNGEILDGRNRLQACKISGIKPRFVNWKGEGSPLTWVISKNMMRRKRPESRNATCGPPPTRDVAETTSVTTVWCFVFQDGRMRLLGTRKPVCRDA